MTDRILIAGGGEAGLSIAVTLRDLGYDGELCMVCAEPVPPYQRPPLSKEFLYADGEPVAVELRAPEFFTDHRIDLILDRTIDAATVNDSGGLAVLNDETEIAFDRIALATGSVSRRLGVPGADLPGVVLLRTLGDATHLRTELDHARRVVIVGGGFIGLEVAATARKRGLDVTIVETADRLMARAVAEPISSFILDRHAAQGIRFLLGTEVIGFAERNGRIGAVGLANGESLPADLVLVGVGAVPATALAEKLGLVRERGIVVDVHARTSHHAVVAAGDCTVQPHPNGLDRLIAIESVNNAVEQGRTAAHTLLNRTPPPRGVPWFWSNQGAVKLQIAGISDGYDDIVVRRDGAERLTALYYRSGNLVAADTVDNPRDHLAAKRCLADGKTIDPASATNPDVPLKSLITSRTEMDPAQ
ncbi:MULTISPECIES: FAD-dependent oxidoreductase [Rhodococcus]|uniref:Aniline dioxygenase n=1 Tax=Rhodococcus sp. AN-22 TaxID=200251 RepID=C0STT9_9NOCA|nr:MULTISPECIES: FAD-dependent oxidoreductase [Rhodococcus]UTT51082.1 FAD-dependent oxidoreductase [Rhodococcus gordoniae]BAH56720.1 [2Fe-2S] ferredoxin reductase [Rhodococcus sp. AN-22]BAI63579.1 aniline dioxygenase [Rhodococcus sp. AN-22]